MNQSDKAFNFLWDTATWATSYSIYLDWSLLWSTTSTWVTITDLTANTNYTVYIKAKNSLGESSASSNVIVKTAPPPPTVTWVASNESQILISWNNVSWATWYYIYNNWSYLWTTTWTSWTISGLNSNTNYNITVRSIGTLNSAISSPSTTLIYSTSPKIPTNITTTHTSNDSISLTWD